MRFDASRRFTDREVAIVLRKAAEIDETEGSGAGGGLSLQDLEEIARDVGISPEAVKRAVGALDEGRSLRPEWAGAPLVRKSVHAVTGELGQEAIARLVQVIDERTESAGTISEALGSVRWTSSDRFKSRLVSITPEAGETTIQVVEKALPRMRRLFHALPAAWAAMIAAPVLGAAGLGAVGTIGAVALSVAAGAAVGRGAWSLMSASSARRVERLADALTREARGAIEHDRPRAGMEDD
jgi:hypothetical protein